MAPISQPITSVQCNIRIDDLKSAKSRQRKLFFSWKICCSLFDRQSPSFDGTFVFRRCLYNKVPYIKKDPSGKTYAGHSSDKSSEISEHFDLT